MALLTETKISIDGKAVKQFSSFSLQQSIFEHHQFRLVCPTEGVDGKEAAILNSSKNFIGASISVETKVFEGNASFKFSGVIVQVQAERGHGHAGNIVITGYSPTILLDNGIHCQTWEKKAIKNIAQEILSQFPQNLLNPKVTPASSETLSYTVQYKETAWRFISRLCATYGEWFFYDGSKLIIGPPKGGSSKLVFGNNLTDFQMSLQVRPAAFQMMAYDYMNHQVYSSSPSGIASKAGLNELGKHSLERSEKFYAHKPKQWHNQFLTNKKQLDDHINTKAAMQSGSMVRFSGASEDPSVAVGGLLKVDGRNVYSNNSESYGEYLVISVDHHCDGQGNYSNTFVAIPSSIKMPPVAALPEMVCETQSAVVTDNHDPKGLGRVRVKFHWMQDTEKSPWLRVTGPHAGDGKGFFFMPEIDEEVIVGFEGNSPSKPFVIGTVFHSNAKTSFANSGNDVKAIQTRSGNKIIMDDKAGSVFVEDKDGNSMKVDGDGNVNVIGNKTIVLTCGESKIEMKKDGTINITGKKITVNAEEKATLVSKQASFTADGNSGDAKMEGMKAAISGSAEAKLAGGAKTEVSASGNVSVKGALITLN